MTMDQAAPSYTVDTDDFADAGVYNMKLVVSMNSG
jgi:hypothetical protein